MQRNFSVVEGAEQSAAIIIAILLLVVIAHLRSDQVMAVRVKAILRRYIYLTVINET